MQIPLWYLDPAEDAGVQSDAPASPVRQSDGLVLWRARTASVINARKVKPAT
jgi:hypothetical protein